MSGILTLDGILAFLAATAILASSMSLMSEEKPQVKMPEYIMLEDTLAVLEQQGALEQATRGSDSLLEQTRSLTPAQICFELKIINSSQETVFSDVHDCLLEGDITVVRRSFVTEDGFYLAELRGGVK